MTTRRRVLAVTTIVVLGAVFLAGYLPERQRRVAAEAERAALQQRVDALEDRARAARLHADLLDLIDAIAAMNYGQAQSLSSTYFDRVRQEIAQTQDAPIRAALESVMAQRDVVTGALAKGDATAAEPLRRAERELRPLLGPPDGQA